MQRVKLQTPIFYFVVFYQFPHISSRHHMFYFEAQKKKKLKQHAALSIKLLLIRLHVDVALELSTGGSKLEANKTAGSALVELSQALHTTVLHRVLETSSQVGHKLVDGTGT